MNELKGWIFTFKYLLQVRNAIQALQDFTFSSIQSQADLNSRFQPARSIPNLITNNIEDSTTTAENDNQGMIRSTSHPPEMWGREVSTETYIANERLQLEQKFDLDFPRKTSINSYNLPEVSSATQTDNAFDHITIERIIRSNPRLVLNILGMNLSLKYRKMSLETISELGSNETLTDLCDNDNESVQSSESNSKPLLPHQIINVVEHHINLSDTSLEHISVQKKTSNTSLKLQAQGHGDACVIILNENNLDTDESDDEDDASVKKRYSNLIINKAPLTNRFSAGDADRIEKGCSIQVSGSLKEI